MSKYTIVDLEKTILQQQPIPTNNAKKKLAAITFDDGYKDIMVSAIPFLIKHQIPYSIYVITDCVNNQTPPWTYILDFLMTNSSILKNNFNGFLPHQFKKSDFESTQERIIFAKKLKPYLKSTNNNFRKMIMKICSETYNDISIPSNLMMSWEDIIYLKNCGANIGSHTHPLMNNIELDLEIKNEFEISKKNLFEKLKESPITISFPVGSVNERIKKIARESGYKIGLAVRGEVFNSQLHDHFEIPRIELYEERMLKFILREKGVIQNSKKIFDFHLSRKRINN